MSKYLDSSTCVGARSSSLSPLRTRVSIDNVGWLSARGPSKKYHRWRHHCTQSFSFPLNARALGRAGRYTRRPNDMSDGGTARRWINMAQLPALSHRRSPRMAAVRFPASHRVRGRYTVASCLGAAVAPLPIRLMPSKDGGGPSGFGRVPRAISHVAGR